MVKKSHPKDERPPANFKPANSVLGVFLINATAAFCMNYNLLFAAVANICKAVEVITLLQPEKLVFICVLLPHNEGKIFRVKLPNAVLTA